MTSPAFSATRESEVESLLAGQLAAADRALADAQKTLRHRLGCDDELIGDRIVAQVRAGIESLAGQLAQGDEPYALAHKLAAEPALVRHIHAIAIEAELAERVSERLALDPVVSPLLQTVLAASVSAKDLLTAQARFVQSQRRGELVLAELPADLREVLPAGPKPTAPANRLDLLEAVVAELDDLTLALDVAQAGVALFATALARALGFARETTLLAMLQAPRLAIALRAAGLSPRAVERQLFALDPDARSPDGLDALSPEHAAALLAGAR